MIHVKTKWIKLKNLTYKHEYISLKELKNIMEGNKYEPPSLFYHYDWKDFIKSIKENGLKNNIKVQIKDNKYLIQDGNHRAIALNYLYGKEHKILIDIITYN